MLSHLSVRARDIRSLGRGTPARVSRVGKMSRVDTRVSETVPAGTRPGQRAKPGTRMPPS
jgi:hypothetical protein